MTYRIDFYEVRSGTPEKWDHVCLCKDKGMAETLASLYGTSCFVRRLDIIASANLSILTY